MNLDVEDVFLGYKVDYREKNKKAIDFQRNKERLLPNLKNLDSINPLNERHASNLLVVLDHFLSKQ